MDISRIASKHQIDLAPYEAIYKDLHAHPGLSLQEHYAASVAGKYLKALPGFDVRTSIGGTGLIGVLKNGEGKTVLLRADIDALPVEELTGLDYASKVREVDKVDGIEKPVMHACGHDMHISAMLAAAKTLHACKEDWKGTLVILFQPNEERGAGASAMIADGLYDPARHNCPIPDVVLGQHVMPFEAGCVGTRPGFFASAADSFAVTVFGQGGHASQPHRTVDPVLLASHIIVRLQSIVSREVDPKESAVVTVASVHSGSAENIITDSATFKLNIRTVTPETRVRVLETIRRVVRAECEASGSPKEAEWIPLSDFPLTLNDASATKTVAEAFKKHFGERHDENATPLGGSEDFAVLATEAPNKNGGKGVPYCYWSFGGIDAEKFRAAVKGDTLQKDIPINHSPYFAPEIQPTLKTGTEAFVVAALAFLTPYGDTIRQRL
ncbi:hypothetical protein F5884DRAFT_419175 [Xylogone sp. PMI_703]|nr:hypothetical protein F5884DRAFT_419175 [Xylogone sp. PMI_703]